MQLHKHKKDPVGKEMLENILRGHSPNQPTKKIPLEELNTLIKEGKIPNSQYTFEDISFLSGVSRQRIHQIEKHAMNKLKMLFSRIENKILREELLQFMRTGLYDIDNTLLCHHMFSETATALKN